VGVSAIVSKGSVIGEELGTVCTMEYWPARPVSVFKQT
jgi:hypothetical protein